MRGGKGLLIYCLVILWGACSDPSPETGTERGPCYDNQTCNSGLICLSDLCVEPESSDGSGEGNSEGGSQGTIDGNVSLDAGSLDGQADGEGIVDSGSLDGDIDGDSIADSGSTGNSADGFVGIDSGNTDGSIDGTANIDSGNTDGSVDGAMAVDSGSIDGNIDSGFIAQADCNGELNGTAYIDDCNICVDGSTGVAACVQDCNGAWGGLASLDCHLECEGSAYTDPCNACVGGSTGEVACTEDCNGEFGGTATLDCNNECNGSAVIDNCSTCTGGATGLVACVADCNGDYGGGAFLDVCGSCVTGLGDSLPCEPTTEDVYSGLSPLCAGCHSGNGNNGFFATLEDFESMVVSNSEHVTPGNPMASELYLLLLGQGTGAYTQMPTYGDTFKDRSDDGDTDITVEAVEYWIQNLDETQLPPFDAGTDDQTEVTADAGTGSAPIDTVDSGNNSIPIDPPVTDGGVSSLATLCEINERIFQGHNCIVCHSDDTNGLNLLAESWASGLVNVSSSLYPQEMMVVPGDPESSLLYRKLAGTLPSDFSLGSSMPLGSESIPQSDLQMVYDWITNGADLDCEAGVSAWDPGPNSMVQDDLFQCSGDGTGDSSPARLRRIERKEWTHAVGKPLGGTWWGSVAQNNPFDAPLHHPYTSYAKEVSIDEAVLELYFFVLPEAGANWITRSPNPNDGVPGTRAYEAYTNEALRCMFDDAVSELTDECINYYIDRFLTKGALFRAPRIEEFNRARVFMDTLLAQEDESDVGAARKTTLRLWTSGVWLTTGALFKEELGNDNAGTGDGRYKLADEELGRALAGTLSSFAPGGQGVTAHPVYTAPPEGYLGEIVTAVGNGTIQDEETRNTLIDAYFGGLEDIVETTDAGVTYQDPVRYDLLLDLRDDKLRAARSEYWLGSKVSDFFREWLDYGHLASAFKDTPHATSEYSQEGETHNHFHPFNLGYSAMAYGAMGSASESNLIEQLDDTIARIVVEDENVLEKLLTSSDNWHLASNQAESYSLPPMPATCETVDDCKIMHCDTQLEVCVNSHGDATEGPCIGDVCPGTTSCLKGNGTLSDALCQPYSNSCHEFGDGQKRCSTHHAKYVSRSNLIYNYPNDTQKSPEARWVSMDPNDRKGVLTHPAWLAAHGSNFEDGASIVYRGKWIRENLFCEVVPPLEFVTVEAQLIPSDPEKSGRQRLEESLEGLIPLGDGSYDDQSTAAPYATCMSCHDKMNSLGKPFEMYNHAGFVRARNHGDERYGNNVTITNFPGASGDVNVNGAIELTEMFANSNHVKRCFIRQTFRYFMGRDEIPSDSCTLSSMEAAYDQRGSFKDALKALVNSETFLYRHDEVEQGDSQ